MISEPFPQHLTYEMVVRSFLALTEEHYPTPDKVLQLVEKMGLQSVKGKIIVLNMLRNTVKQVSPTRLYRSIQHRDDIYMAIIEALEELEDELEELEDAQAEENEDTKEE